ncbi:hypothetical protein GCM10022252_44920 [Streptosporangium oxazolinicum]|uniref:Amino acid adenylation domain-containing protein n=1 Tax=Streptosporangium oxazolinicum TaxID=909287 RepID=A0ABP8B3A7_9ACTN
MVEPHARERPETVAVDEGGTRLSYRELGIRSAAVARALRAVEGRPVAVRMPRGAGQAVAVLGALRAGAYVVCLGAGDVGDRGRAMLGELGPAALVGADDALARWFRDELGGRVVDPADLVEASVVSAGRGSVDLAEALAVSTGRGSVHPAEASVVSAGRGSVDLVEALAVSTGRGSVHPAEASAVSAGRGSVDMVEASAAPIGRGPADRAYVAYTSGTTGRPKGIPHTHGTLSQFVTWFAGEFGIGPGARVAQWAMPGYDANLMEIFAALAAGATLCPVPERTRTSPERIVDWLAAERITHFQTVPSFARTCRHVLRELPDLGHLLLAGEPLSGELAGELRALLPAVRLVNLYGPTESILATWFEVDGPVRGTVPIGGPVPGRRVLVVDGDDGPCPPGVTGEIVVLGPHVTPGYVGASAKERSAFRPLAGLPLPTYRTGDRGRWREDGVLEFLGRGDSQVKFNGSRLELADLEETLAAQGSVAECAVRAEVDADGLVTRLVAYVVPRDPGAARAAWRGAVRRTFGDAMPPLVFKIFKELPRNAGGKVDRSRLEKNGDPARN